MAQKHARLGRNNSTQFTGFRSDRIYGQWNKIGNLTSRVSTDITNGVEPVVSIMMTQNGIRWADVAAGKHDAELDNMAKAFIVQMGPGIIIPQHEPDNQKNRQMVGGKIDWNSYRLCAERVVKRFQAAGVQKGWRFAVNTTGWDKSVLLPAMFTGAEFMTGDRYNWAFTYHNPTGSRWNSFENECAPVLAAAKEAGVPAAVFETNCMEDPKDAGRKAQWLKDAFQFTKDANLRRMIFFEGDPLVKWVIKSSPQATAVVNAAAADPYFAG